MAASLMVLCALLAAPSPHLSEGIRLFKAQNYSEALEALTRAIDEQNSTRDKARIHVYIGLIQFRFSMKNDASASFEQALDYDPKLELPKKSSDPAARKLFAKIKRDKVGDVPPKKRKRSKPGDPKLDSDPEETVESPPPPPPPPTIIATAPPPPPSLEPPPPPPPEIAPPPPPPVTRVSTEESGGVNLPAWISISAGAAAAVTAAVLTGVAVHNFMVADDELYAFDAHEAYERAGDYRTGAIVAGSVGVVGIGLGTVFFLVE